MQLLAEKEEKRRVKGLATMFPVSDLFLTPLLMEKAPTLVVYVSIRIIKSRINCVGYTN